MQGSSMSKDCLMLSKESATPWLLLRSDIELPKRDKKDVFRHHELVRLLKEWKYKVSLLEPLVIRLNFLQVVKLVFQWLMICENK